MRNFCKHTSIDFAFVAILVLCAFTKGFSQGKTSIQIKTFDQQLKPYPNIDLSINDKEFVRIGTKGVLFFDVDNTDLPPKSITVKDELIEAESWNYSKGILEIILRKKSYRISRFRLRDGENKNITNAAISYEGKKKLETVSNNNGEFLLPLALDERIDGREKFKVADYTVTKLILGEKENILVVKPVVVEVVKKKDADPVQSEAIFKNFDFNNLDSIQSLTVFYAVMKNYQVSELSESLKKRIDSKFKQLVNNLADSLRNPGTEFITRISGESYVSDDVSNLLAQADAESATLDELRSNFEDKIEMINEKLSGGVANLDPVMREKLLADVGRLQSILNENERKFYKNKSYYEEVLSSIKQKFFDISELENKLSESEAQREQERINFQDKLGKIFIVALCFGLVTVLLIYFSNNLKKHQKALVKANTEIKRINENLEGLVSERTALLENAHREMDIFLYKASHDLRGPICSIIGLCNIASRTVNSESLELVQMTYNTAYSMDRMLKKLKIISEINQPSNYSLIMMDEYLRDIRQEFRGVIRDNNINFTVESNTAISFHSYPNLIEVILHNLVENALFYSLLKKGSSPQVQVKAILKHNYVELTVYDNGVGVDLEIRDRVWDMFFIGNEESNGNGLGLYIVRKSVQVLGGNMFLESEKGKFTRVVVIIPVAETSLSEKNTKPALLEADPVHS